MAIDEMVSTRQSCNGSGGENNEASHSHLPWPRSRSTGSSSASDGLNTLSLSSLPQAGHSGIFNSLASVPSLCSSSSRSGVSSASSVVVEPLNLLDMPPEVLEKIFSYVGFHTVAQLRLVCTIQNCFVKFFMMDIIGCQHNLAFPGLQAAGCCMLQHPQFDFPPSSEHDVESFPSNKSSNAPQRIGTSASSSCPGV